MHHIQLFVHIVTWCCYKVVDMMIQALVQVLLPSTLHPTPSLLSTSFTDTSGIWPLSQRFLSRSVKSERNSKCPAAGITTCMRSPGAAWKNSSKFEFLGAQSCPLPAPTTAT